MSWFKRLRKVADIPITSLSCKNTSHSDRVIDITWLPPNVEVSTIILNCFRSICLVSTRQQVGAPC